MVPAIGTVLSRTARDEVDQLRKDPKLKRCQEELEQITNWNVGPGNNQEQENRYTLSLTWT